METVLNRIYGAIVNDLTSMIIEDWNTIYFFSEIHEKLHQFYFYYKDSKSQIKDVNFLLDNGLELSYQDKINSDITKYLFELKEAFIYNKQETWDLFCFELKNTGEISVHFEYDLPKRARRSFYRVRWEYNTLGLTHNFEFLTDEERKEIIAVCPQ